MAETSYDILFSGELTAGSNRDVVRARIQELFKLTDQAADRLFSGRTIAVKRGLDAKRAARMRDAFKRAGARVRLIERVPETSTGPKADAAPPPTDAQPAAAAADSGLRLAPVDGRPLEPEAKPAQPDIDISGLSLVLGNDWTLEDCEMPLPPVPVPDIGHLQIVEPEPASETATDPNRES
jgi:hypothetical protein